MNYTAPYDYKSIMHYSIYAFGLTNNDQVIEPKDPSVFQTGGVEMTEYDKLKLQSAYGCSACGGHQYSASGGSLQAISSVTATYCDWVLRTGDNMQIKLDFSVRNHNFDF